MKKRLHLSTLALLAGVLSLLPACNPKGANAQGPAVPAPAAAVQQPTSERLTARAGERWAKIVKNDWIEAYDFMSPEQKKALPIGQYLLSKQKHKYENARIHEVLQNDGKIGMLRISALWTPVGPEVDRAMKTLEPGQTLTQDVEMYETWRWAEGDWTYLRAQRPEDFFTEHPQFLKAGEKIGAGEPQSPGK